MRERFKLPRPFLRSTLPMLAAILLLGTGVFTISFISITRISQSNERSKLERLDHYYESILSEIDALAISCSTSNEIIDILTGTEEQPELSYEAYHMAREYEKLLSAFIATRPYLREICIYIENGNGLVFTSTGFQALDRIERGQWLSEQVKVVQGGNMFIVPFSTGDQDFIRTGRPVLNSNGKIIGLIIFDLNISFLSEAYLPYRTYDGERLSVRTESGDLLFRYPRMDTEDRWMVSFSSRSGAFGWEYSLQIPYRSLYQLPVSILWFTLLLVALALALGSFLTYRTNKSERLFISSVIDEFRKAGATTELEEYRSTDNLYKYLQENIIKTFIEKEYLKLQKDVAEYKALQLQINPHFLFNTLDTIYWKAVRLTGGDNEASDMIHELSKLLKYSLATDLHEGSTLSQEIEQLETYINIQRVRFRNKFRFVKEWDGLCDVRIPGFTLQPLVENCFNHGFLEGQVLEIRLEVKAEEDWCTIVVSDNGRGVSKEKLESLNAETGSALMSSSSIGLGNIRDRLALFYQGRASIRVRSENEKGFAVVIRVPCKL